MAQLAAFGSTPYSSTVDLWLETGTETIPLSHVGPGFIRSQTPHRLPPTDGVVVIVIDGNRRENKVRLDHGMNEEDDQTFVRPLDTIPF